jgi:hypothetical protein
MPRDNLSNPRTNIEAESGSGLFSPFDREFQAMRLKARAVLEGRDSFTFAELSKFVAKLIDER